MKDNDELNPFSEIDEYYLQEERPASGGLVMVIFWFFLGALCATFLIYLVQWIF